MGASNSRHGKRPKLALTHPVPYRHNLTATRTQTFSMSDPTSPCFNFDAVLQAQLSCFLTISPNVANVYSTPLFFAAGVNATVLNTYMITESVGGNPTLGSIFSTSQQTIQTVGPAITETLVNQAIPGYTLLVSPDSANGYNTYCFQRISGPPYANPAILINVFSGESSAGYLTFTKNELGIYIPTLVSQEAAVTQKAQFGVVGCLDELLQTSLVLAYMDSNVTTPTAMALISFGQDNVMTPFSTASSGGSFTLHGLYAANAGGPDLTSVAFNYNSATMMVLDNTLFESTNPNSLLLWQLQFLTTGALQASSALAYMETYCVGVVSDGTCSNTSEKTCTPFTSKNPVGVSCRKMGALSNTSTDYAYMNTCGLDPRTGKPLATLPFPEVLATADCSCVNFAQSTYPQIIGTPPTLDYAGWQAWLKKNNLPAADPSTATCWWPGCTINKANSLILSSMPTNTKPCTNIVDCLTVVNSTVQPGGSVSVKALNACGLNGPQGGGGGGGGGGKSEPFYKTQTFNVVLTITILVLLLGVGFYLYRSAGPTMPSTR